MKRILTAVFVLLASLTSTTVLAQGGYQVKGVVVDAQGPVIGATVMEQGTSVGTVTGLDGDYVLKVSSADAVIEVSCIGYATQTFKASEVPATILLGEDTEFLDEVVVIGYGTVKKSDLTGSVATVKADDINRGAVTSPDQMLMGKVAGLLVTPASGQPGASATIRIRGAASLNASNDPLIVIDGVPITSDGGAGMGNPLASVNPNDIESYSVLKDASATAIYGSRASNGVIIITTKKGTGSKLRVNYNGSVSAKQNYQFFNMMNGKEYADYIQSHYPGSARLLGYNGTNYDTNWQKEIYRLAINTDHNLSVYGGGKLPFRISAGYNLDQATVKVGDNQRANLDVSLSPKLFDNHLSINLNAKGIYQRTNWANGGAVGNALSFDPTKPTVFPAGDPMEGVIWNWYGTTGDPNTMASTNPLSNLYEWKDMNHTLRSIGNFQADYKVHGFEDLRINANLGYDVAKTEGGKYNELGSFSSKAASPDLAEQYANFNSNVVFEIYGDYSHDFGWSNIDAMAGYSWQHNYVKYDNTRFRNVEPRWQKEDIYSDLVSDAKEYYLLSFFGRVNYGILNKYLFTVTVREDASSRFSPKNRWGLFPSAAFAWNIKNESFLKNVDFFSQLKLRLGWGRTGQQDVGGDYYPYLARYTFSTSTNMMYDMGNGDRHYTFTPQAYNPNLKWETTETTNIGLDFGILGEKVTGSIEAYYRRTFDLLNQVSAPLGTNFSNRVLSNVGEMENKGVELNLNYNVIETRDWHWSVGGNVTFQDVKITKLTNFDEEHYPGVHAGGTMGSNEGYSSLYKTGYAPYTYYLYQQVYDKNGLPVMNMLVDRAEDGAITESDRYLTGRSATPWMYFGVNTHLSWKNWDFSVNGHGSLGNYALNKVRKGYSYSYSVIDQTAKVYLNNFNKDFLYEDWTDVMSTPQEYSDLWLENASFFKIDDINLGYTFKVGKPWMESLRVAGSVQNVYTFTRYSGLDPELPNIDGVDNNFMPRPRLFTVRLNINF